MVITYSIVSVHAEPSFTEIMNDLGFTNVSKINATDVTFPAGRYNVTLLCKFGSYHNKTELSFYKIGTNEYNAIFAGSEGGLGYTSPPISKIFTTNNEFGLSALIHDAHVPGDYNYDEEVNMTDADMVRVAWQSRKGEPNYNPDMDYNVDEIVNIGDAAMIGVNWLKKSSLRYFTQNSLNPDEQIHSSVYENLNAPTTYLVGFGDEDHQDIVVYLQNLGPDFVVPEVPFGTIITMTSMMIALAWYICFKHLRPRLKLQ